MIGSIRVPIKVNRISKNTMAKKSKDHPTYEEALKELQEIVGLLQEEAVSIDDLSDKVKRAAELIKYCKEKLRSTGEELETLFE